MLPQPRSEEGLSAALYLRCLSPTSSCFASPLSSASAASQRSPTNSDGTSAVHHHQHRWESEERKNYSSSARRCPSPKDDDMLSCAAHRRPQVNASFDSPPVNPLLRTGVTPSSAVCSCDCSHSSLYAVSPSPKASRGYSSLTPGAPNLRKNNSFAADPLLPSVPRSSTGAAAVEEEPWPGAYPPVNISPDHPLFSTIDLTSHGGPHTSSPPPLPRAARLAHLAAATPVCSASSYSFRETVTAAGPDKVNHEPDSCSVSTWKKLLMTERQTAASPKKQAEHFVFEAVDRISEKDTLRQCRDTRPAVGDDPGQIAAASPEAGARRPRVVGSADSAPVSAAAAALASSPPAATAATSTPSSCPAAASPLSSAGPASAARRTSVDHSSGLSFVAAAAAAPCPPCSYSLSTLLALAPPPVHPPFITPASDAVRRAAAAAALASATESQAAAKGSHHQQQQQEQKQQQKEKQGQQEKQEEKRPSSGEKKKKRHDQKQDPHDEDDNETPPTPPPSSSYSTTSQEGKTSSGVAPFDSSFAASFEASAAPAKKFASASSSRVEGSGGTGGPFRFRSSVSLLLPQAHAAAAAATAFFPQAVAAPTCCAEESLPALPQAFTVREDSCTQQQRLTPVAPAAGPPHSTNRRPALPQQPQQQTRRSLPEGFLSEKRTTAADCGVVVSAAATTAAAEMALSAAREASGCGRGGTGEAECEEALSSTRDEEQHRSPGGYVEEEGDGEEAAAAAPLLAHEEGGEFCRGCCAAGGDSGSSSRRSTRGGCSSSGGHSSRRGGAMRGLLLLLVGVGIGLGLWPMLFSLLTFRLLHAWNDLAGGGRHDGSPQQHGGADFDDLHGADEDSSSTGGRGGGVPGRQQQQQPVPPLPTPPPSFSPIRFDDLAGLQEVKTELQELVDFLREPQKFEKLGARLPKGVLLVGPPGTGKTALARAVATEAGVPYLYASGSEFVEVYVGQGARRVRGLFAYARMHSPCIIFLDELDAVGGRRTAATAGPGSREHDQTLNQLLVEMDGFNSQHNRLVVLAATNRVDTLDPALLRPGRFDRLVYVPLPDVAAREAILLKYLQRVPLISEEKDAAEEKEEEEGGGGEQQLPEVEQQKAETQQQQQKGGERRGRDKSAAARAASMLQKKKSQQQQLQQQEKTLQQEQQRQRSASSEDDSATGGDNKKEEETSLQQPPMANGNSSSSRRKTGFGERGEAGPDQQQQHCRTDRENGGTPNVVEGQQESQTQQQQQRQKQKEVEDEEQQQQEAESRRRRETRGEAEETARNEEMRLQNEEAEKDRRLAPAVQQQQQRRQKKEGGQQEQKAQQQQQQEGEEKSLRKEGEAAAGREEGRPAEGGARTTAGAAAATDCPTHAENPSKTEEIRKKRQKITPLHRELAKKMARLTPGFSGAELENLVNEAALLAARANKDVVSLQELQEARDKATMGPARKSRVMSAWQRQLTAYHEAGHAIVAFYLQPYADPIHKATVVSRGTALGFVEQVPLEDRYGHGVAQLEARLCVCMGGRVAERLVFGREALSNGASSDIETATKMAYAMVTEWGMSEKLGPLSYKTHGRSRRAFISSHTAALVEQEVKELVMTAERKAEQLLRKHRSKLRTVALQLLEKETLSGEEIAELVDPTGSYRRKVEQLRQHMQQGEVPGLLQRVVVMLQRGLRTLRSTFFPSPHSSSSREEAAGSAAAAAATAEEAQEQRNPEKQERMDDDRENQQRADDEKQLQQAEAGEQQQQQSEGGEEIQQTREQQSHQGEEEVRRRDGKQQGSQQQQRSQQQQQREPQEEGVSSKKNAETADSRRSSTTAATSEEEAYKKKQRGDATSVGRQQQQRHGGDTDDDSDNADGGGEGGSSSCSTSPKTSSTSTPSSSSSSRSSSSMESDVSWEGQASDVWRRIGRDGDQGSPAAAAVDPTAAGAAAPAAENGDIPLLQLSEETPQAEAAAVWNPRLAQISRHDLRLQQQQAGLGEQQLTALLLLRGAEEGAACSSVHGAAGGMFCPAEGLAADAAARTSDLCRGDCGAEAEDAAAATAATAHAAAAGTAAAAPAAETTAAAAEEEAAAAGRGQGGVGGGRSLRRAGVGGGQGREETAEEEKEVAGIGPQQRDDGGDSILQLRGTERLLSPAEGDLLLLHAPEKRLAAADVIDDERRAAAAREAAEDEAAVAVDTSSDEGVWGLSASPLLLHQQQQQRRRKTQQQQWQLTPWGPGIVTVNQGYSL